ncbi:hypothetical protein EWM60_20955, partial [Candidatus Erwinia dacicola]|nr:hypothetical protein [Candidatus Erwinia dacicola]
MALTILPNLHHVLRLYPKLRRRSRFRHLVRPYQAFIRKELSIHILPEVISGRLQLEFGISVSKNMLYR